MTDTDLQNSAAGATQPGNEDEFKDIPAPRGRHPVIALATVALAGFLLFQLKDDVTFALSSSSAVDLGDARRLASAKLDSLPMNRYVRISGAADRESGVILDTQGSWEFRQFFRLLGTGSRVFVSRAPDPLPADLAQRDVFLGRLVRFSDLSFAASIRKHFVGYVSATHFFPPAALRAAVAEAHGETLAVTDLLGERVSLGPNDELAIDVARPGQIQMEFPRERFADEAAARSAVEQNGGQVVESVASATAAKSITLVVTFPSERRDQALHVLGEMDQRVRIRPARSTQRCRVADLSAAADELSIQGRGAIKLADIQAVATLAAVEIPGDAILLREGERPRDQLKTLIIVAFLVGFASVNLLALRRRG